MIILPVYGSMSTEKQNNIFEMAPEGCWKLIFATNIAETSLTVDGIAYIVDSGFVKQKLYNPDTGVESLQIIPISKV